ncbi:permease [Candidatus Magnetobacterium bavaricum]|uniref:Permease n=1 Tax=Candidatus Magnetobacterium bavaricum TaxID=29290 RepID=A0A0F3H2B0_9BACT|nr:permease [Candidatus Magnetobacterium bavaricum]
MIYSLYIIAAMLIWSSQGIVVRMSGLPVEVLVCYSNLFAMAGQSLIFLSPSIRAAVPPLRKFHYIIIYAILVLTNTMTYFIAYEKTSISNTVFTHYIAPVVVAMLAPLLLKERVSVATIVSLIVATIGLWFILGDISLSELARGGGADGNSNRMGILAGLASGVAYALVIIFLRAFAPRYNSYFVVFFQNSFVALSMLVFLIAKGHNFFDPGGHIPRLGSSFWIFILMAIMYSTVAPYLYYRGLTYVEANRAAVLGYTEPLSAIALSVLFLSELPNLRSIIGGVLILLSGYIVIRGGTPQTERVP